jgi:ABC-type glycerol-3-phosphate transport system substrate-binding protein
MRRAHVMRWAGGAVAASVLAACGAPSGGAAGATAGPKTQAPASPAPRSTTVVVSNDWTQGDRLRVVQAWLARANRVYPTIKTELYANADTQEKIIAQFAADQQGDLVQVDQHMIPVFGPKGLLEDITPTLNALRFDLASIFDIDTITTWKGKRHGLLIQLNSNVWIYNKSLFQQHGVAEPTDRWTWQDHLEAARRMTNPDLNQWGMNVRVDLYPWYWQAGVDYLTPDGLKTLFDSAGSKQVVQWLADAVTRHRAAPNNQEAAEKKPTFAAGNYATNLTGSPGAPLTKAIDNRFVWEIMPTPRHPTSGKRPGLVVTGHNYAITKKATQRGNARESAQVLVELFDKEIQQLYIDGSLDPGSSPILKSVATSPEALKPPPQNARVVIDQIPTGRNYDKIIGFRDMHQAITAEYNKAIDGLLSASDAAESMKQMGDAALANAAR